MYYYRTVLTWLHVQRFPVQMLAIASLSISLSARSTRRAQTSADTFYFRTFAIKISLF